MDDKSLNQSLKETLTERAQHAVSNDYDLWSHIQEAIDSEETDPMKAPTLRVAPSNPRRTRRLIYVLVAALLLTTTAVYAVYQTQLPLTDAGLAAMNTAGNITQLNLVQRVDDVEVRLNWAYIDEGRTVFNFETFLVNDDGTLTPADADTPFQVRYWDTLNNLIAPAPMRYDYSTFHRPVTVTFLPPPVYFAPGVNEVGIVFELTFEQPPRVRNALERLLSGGLAGSRSFFGGNGMSKVSPESTAEPMPSDSGVFTFKFSLPLFRSVTVKPELVITDVPGFTFYVNTVKVDASQVTIDMCYETTADDFMWWPELEIESEERFVGYSHSGYKSEIVNQSCVFSTYRTHVEVPGEVTFGIENMTRSTPIRVDEEYLKIKEAFAQRGIELNPTVDEEGRITQFGYPEDAPYSVHKEVMIELGYLIEGPWEFTVEIPEP